MIPAVAKVEAGPPHVGRRIWRHGPRQNLGGPLAGGRILPEKEENSMADKLTLSIEYCTS